MRRDETQRRFSSPFDYCRVELSLDFIEVGEASDTVD